MTTATSPTHQVCLFIKSITFDFTVEDGTKEQQEVVSNYVGDYWEMSRYSNMGDSLDRDILTEVLIDDITDDSGWCIEDIEIDWSKSSIHKN